MSLSSQMIEYCINLKSNIPYLLPRYVLPNTIHSNMITYYLEK